MNERQQQQREFRRLVNRELGLAFAEHQSDFLLEKLRERAAGRGCTQVSTYLDLLAASRWPDENVVLARCLTVPETYFFRGMDHFQALIETVLPTLRRRTDGSSSKLKLLSAGCASGEEAYTVAIMLREHAPWLGQVEITAVDVNPDALAKARSGRYTAWSLRETPAWARQRYFCAVGSDYVLDEAIRQSVTFEQRNLAMPDAGFWRPGAFDVVFCRNMLMYLDPPKMAALVGWMTDALRPDGFLFLGHAETLRGIPHAFDLRRHGEAFFYQMSGGATPDCDNGSSFSPFARIEASPPFVDTAWFHEIGRASARVVEISSQSSDRIASASEPANEEGAEVPASADEWEQIKELHRQERFEEALTRMHRLPAAGEFAERQVLQAILLVNCGRLEEADALAQALLVQEQWHGGAFYVAALCREQLGRLADAEEHYRRAASLDAHFALPRFHLGLICKRLGRRHEAKRHLLEALALLAQEDPDRLAMFGGGFRRETLMECCRAELRRMGGAL
ncbi:MAG TPA: CheR family methyltransferase [Phycisphaerae bacterium]|nr:CheR family methyltransferase [Phycisphaerae bacterium]